jgi:general secretion pathway protein B
MSYILDALRKSEQERQTGTPARPGGPVHNVSLPWRGGWLVVIGIILLLFLLAAAVVIWHNTSSRISSVAAVAVTSPSVAPVAAPPAAEVVAVAPPPVAAVKKESPVRDLAEQTEVPVHVTSIKPKPSTAPRRKVASIKQTPSSRANGPAVLLETDNTPLLQQMPPEIQRAIPPMAVTIHVYSPQESQRILFINNHEYHQGSLVEGGARVEVIVPDGVVLSYQGERFKLPRPH